MDSNTISSICPRLEAIVLLAYSCYQLASRRGALLQVTWDDGLIGYGDCHPWEILGDLPIEEQLRSWRDPSSLMYCSLQMARVDAIARSLGVSLLDGLTVPESHYLICDHSEELSLELLKSIGIQGFTHIKLKVARAFDAAGEASRLREMMLTPLGKKFLWRLDANGLWDGDTFEIFLKALGEARELVDFIEDPTPFSRQHWQRWQRDYGIAIAADRYMHDAVGESSTAKVLIVKPAIIPLKQAFAALETEQRFVVTHYMDHPVGQRFATWCASVLYRERPDKRDVCGLHSYSYS